MPILGKTSMRRRLTKGRYISDDYPSSRQLLEREDGRKRRRCMVQEIGEAHGHAMFLLAMEWMRWLAIMEIQGKYNTAVCYANVIEEAAVEQIRRMMDYDFVAGSKIRIMPDVHAGKGCTIGTTMTITDKICPNLVGVDIGCGMLTTRIGNKDIDFDKLDDACHTVPSGWHVWEGRQERFDLMRLNCYRELKDTKRLERSLGTLGGGNHFIEMDKASDGSCSLVIHSGSRNLGVQVAEYYQKLAIELNQGKEDYLRAREELIKTYKEQGRRKEIQEALKKLVWERKDAAVPEDLCYLYGEFMEKYLHDVVICQEFADRSRKLMAQKICDICGYEVEEQFSTVHNYISVDEMILRKGAISAKAGEKVLIPMNMRDGCILGIGKGNPEWNYSAPHGAGRLMSRSAAREKLDMKEYRKTMEDIYTTSVVEATLDEAPMAYKRMEDILEDVREAVDIVDILKPVYNFKATE